jgi:hypothetical protein
MPGFFVLLEATRPRLSRSANGYFQIPTGRVVEVGTQVTIEGVSLSIPIIGRCPPGGLSRTQAGRGAMSEKRG